MGAQEHIAFKKAVTDLWLKGLSYADVARRVGVSRQRVQQIVRPPKAIYDLVVKRAGGACQDCKIVMASGHVHHANHVDDTFNDIENLVYLCPGCHRMRHGLDGGGCDYCGGSLRERWINGWGFTRCVKCKKVRAGAPKRQHSWDKKAEQAQLAKRAKRKVRH